MSVADRWARVEEIFHEALARPPAQRRAFVEAACRADEGLQAEVLALLKVDRTRPTVAYGPLAQAAAEWLGASAPDPRVGTAIGPYDVTATLGAGGMGQVYAARDRRLGRLVALKFLPSAATCDQARISRFFVEARAASRLAHPNVAALHDLCDVGGERFIVMEYVAGETLDSRIRQGPIPLDQALGLLRQAAAALEEAHKAGITHRDIKPGNLMVTGDGVVKVLDFGLAKLSADLQAGDAPAPDPLGTTPGLVMGTVSYMSPEQALGQPVDHRSDLFSLGVVAYETLTGRLPFSADSSTATIDAIVHQAPARPSRLRPGLPRAVDRVLMRAIEKRPDDRYQTAAAFGRDLEALAGGMAPSGAPRRWRRGRRGLGAAAAGVVVAVGVGVVAWSRLDAPPSTPTAAMRLAPFTTFAGVETYPAFAPDGETLAYAWDGAGGGNVDIYVHRSGQEPRRLTTAPGVDLAPVFSPDARLVAFVRDEARLRLIPAAGGEERDLGPVAHAIVDFTPDGHAVAFADASTQGITLAPLDGMARVRVTSPPAGVRDVAPRYSPDGRWLAFLRAPTTAVEDLHVARADGSDVRRLTFDDRSIPGYAWDADGHGLIFSSGREGYPRLWRVPLAGGSPQSIVETGNGASMPAVSRSGRIAFNRAVTDSNLWELSLDAAGRPEGPPRQSAVTSTWPDASGDYTPDRRSVAFVSSRAGRDELWVSEVDSVLARPVTDFGARPASSMGSPRWSPDGRLIAFDARVGGNADIYVVNPLDRRPRRLTSHLDADVVPSWSRDGRWIYFTSRRTGRNEAWRIPVSGGREEQLTRDGGFGPQESLDGQWLIYGKDRVNSSLWRRPAAGGAETPMLVDVAGRARQYALFSAWRPTLTGVIFIERVPVAGPLPTRTDHVVQAFDLARRATTALWTLTAPPALAHGGLAVSRDGRRVMFTQVDRRSSDIMLLEPVR